MVIDPEVLAKRKRMQMEMILKDSDVKKNQRLASALEAEIRGLKMKKQQIESEIALKEKGLKNAQSKSVEMQNELIRLKHKMNSIN